MDAGSAGRPPRVLARDGTLTDDRWPTLRAGAAPDATGPALLPLGDYLAAQSGAHGVWLAPTDDPAALAPHLDRIRLIGVLFPAFADGRGYSIATILRRQGYRGDMRAIGEVLVDQLFLLKRTGFTSFELRADQSVEEARAALQRYSGAYQAEHDGAAPAFRRSLAR